MLSVCETDRGIEVEGLDEKQVQQVIVSNRERDHKNSECG